MHTRIKYEKQSLGNVLKAKTGRIHHNGGIVGCTNIFPFPMEKIDKSLLKEKGSLWEDPLRTGLH